VFGTAVIKRALATAEAMVERGAPPRGDEWRAALAAAEAGLAFAADAPAWVVRSWVHWAETEGIDSGELSVQARLGAWRHGGSAQAAARDLVAAVLAQVQAFARATPAGEPWPAREARLHALEAQDASVGGLRMQAMLRDLAALERELRAKLDRVRRERRRLQAAASGWSQAAVGAAAARWHDAAMRSSHVMFGLWWSAAIAVAQAPGAPSPAPAAVHGRIEQHAGLTVVRVWGTAQERGYAHGRLLADRFAATALAEFGLRFGRLQPLLQQARQAQARLIEYPPDVQQELQGLWQGLVDSKVDLRMPELERAFDYTDLLVANALDVFGLMGCSSFTLWGEQVEGGGVLTARNFDWPLTGPHLLEHTILLVQHPSEGRATASVTWPGFVGTVTGISDDGMAAFLHVGSAKITYALQPSSWPTATAARAILGRGAAGEPAATWQFAIDQLGYTSPPAGYLTHVVLPSVPATGAPVGVFETDARKVVRGECGDGAFVLTNHFRTRVDGRAASGDSEQREQRLGKGLTRCLQTDDRRLSIGEVWDVLGSVQRGGGHAFGTLHALVFRHEPWCFELRVAEQGAKGIVGAPASARRITLGRDQVFPSVLPAAR
jgi:Acyl-coenzyme A:6-aminopenicillanic acid acyl-transferase